LVGLLVLLVAAALLWAGLAHAEEQADPSGLDGVFLARPAAHRLALDLFVFTQGDGGGNPLVAEGFDYQSIGLDVRFPMGGRRVVQGTANFAYLQNDPLQPLPGTIGNADVTSASADFVTLDTSLKLELPSSDGGWLLVPGLFYHHQWGYLAGGLDLDVRRVLAGGDTVLRVSYAGRFARLNQDNWDGEPWQFDQRISNNFLVSFTQTLSPAVIADVSLQYTLQQGLLHSTLRYVALYDAGGAPVLLVDELLPRARERWQLNLRGRWSPRRGRSFGLDLSGYRDDWGVEEATVEPSFETPLPHGLRGRLWYRVAVQRGSRFFVERPTEVLPYMTQDSSLGSFALQSAGVVVLVPLGARGAVRWVLRAAALGFLRSDHVGGAGGSVGASAEW
jgi:hypothetical protein